MRRRKQQAGAALPPRVCLNGPESSPCTTLTARTVSPSRSRCGGTPPHRSTVATRRGSRSGAEPNRRPETLRSYLLRSYVYCKLRDRRMLGKPGKGLSYCVCYKDDTRRSTADWAAQHPPVPPGPTRRAAPVGFGPAQDGVPDAGSPLSPVPPGDPSADDRFRRHGLRPGAADHPGAGPRADNVTPTGRVLCAPGRTRTCGQALRRRLLYPLSYGGRPPSRGGRARRPP